MGPAGEGHHCPHQHPRHHALLRGHPPSITPFSRLDFTSGPPSGFTSPSLTHLFILLRSTATALVCNAIIRCNLLAAASVNFVFLTPFLIISPEVCSEALHITDTRLNCPTAPPHPTHILCSSHPSLKGFSDILARRPASLHATSSGVLQEQLFTTPV